MKGIAALRMRLVENGFTPLPLYGKEPPVYGKNNKRKGLQAWQQLQAVTREQIDMWSKTWPDAVNTGCLCRSMPTLDADILNEDAVRTIVAHVRDRYEESGYVLPRIGKPPKCAIPFRTEEPFPKFKVSLIAPNGRTDEKIEFLADGEQVVVAGIHPETGKPYRWHGGEPGPIALAQLPYIREDEARQLVDELVELLAREHGYTRKQAPRKQNGAGHQGGGADWQYLFDNIREGRELHDSINVLAAKMIKAGTNSGAAVNQIRALMEASAVEKDARWRERYGDIPRAVDTAVEKYRAPEQPGEGERAPAAKTAAAYTIEDAIRVYERWLILPDRTPVYALLGAVAGNLLPGDPVWLGLVAPPSSAKTELLNSVAGLPHMVQTATVTMAALLSGTPKKQHAIGAKGGLLRQIGDFGFLLLKDFGSILSMRQESKAEVLGALREIFDGAWTRHLGTDGGRTLAWKGKIGLLFGVTGVIDSHYAVIGAMGDRYLLCRLKPGEGQLKRALDHAGSATPQMRKELAEAATQLFAVPRREPRPLTPDEFRQLDETVSLVVRLRGAVDRDRNSREIEAIYGAEGTARIGLCLERLLAGLDTLGVDRTIALGVIKSVAMDSVPPLRRAAYEYLLDKGKAEIETGEIAEVLDLPTNTVRRALEDLAAYHLVRRARGGQGKSDKWVAK